MGKWREAFEHGRPSEWDTEYGLEYTFGPPATGDQLAAAEAALGVRLPADIREMLSEFNGIWATSEVGRREGYEPDILFLDTKCMSMKVPEHLRTCGDEPMPPEEDLRKVVFVCQSNGFANLWGVCLEDVNSHRVGQVVTLDHEVGELEPCANSLSDFVRDLK